jgi:hypothetical protein
MGIPFEIITMLGSSVLGGVMSMWGQAQKNKMEREKMLMQKRDQEMQMVEAARKADPFSALTRRVIALTAVFSIILLPKLAAIFYPDLLVAVGYTEWQPGFWFFTEGQDAVIWKEFSGGLIITPLDTNLMSALVGFYFGASAVKR